MAEIYERLIIFSNEKLDRASRAALSLRTKILVSDLKQVHSKSGHIYIYVHQTKEDDDLKFKSALDWNKMEKNKQVTPQLVSSKFLAHRAVASLKSIRRESVSLFKTRLYQNSTEFLFIPQSKMLSKTEYGQLIEFVESILDTPNQLSNEIVNDTAENECESNNRVIKEARERGVQVMQHFSESEEMLNLNDAAKLLNLSVKEISQMCCNGSLLGLKVKKHQSYESIKLPKWQFDCHLFPRLKDILDVLDPVNNWAKWAFFKTPWELLGERTPLEFLGIEVANISSVNIGPLSKESEYLDDQRVNTVISVANDMIWGVG